ncbi:MAG: arylesterase, partial [Magnetovibrio sp.]|nr:arylesterase [Magnetovibrio sp.]
LLNKDVRAVIIELGANDGLRGIDPVETRKNLSWILGHLKELQIKVLLTGMKAPPNLGKDYGHDFNSIYTDLARQFSVAFDPFYLQDVAAVEHLNQADGIHPNARGVAKIVQRLSPQIVKLLSQKKPTP